MKALSLAALLLLPLTSHGEWYRGNTHTHTISSDGDSAPDTVVRWYREHGYQFLFITDHEFITDPAPLNALFGAAGRFLVLSGQEVTQWGADPKRSSAHVNALFTSQVIFPIGERTCSGGACGATVGSAVPLKRTVDTNIAAIRAAGGIAQINHPNWRWSLRVEDLRDVPDYTLLEIWNGQHVNNLGGVDEQGRAVPSSTAIWDTLLSAGKIIWGVASDDSHNFRDPANRDLSLPGVGWIVVRAGELSAKAIEAAIRQGDFYASNGVALDDLTASTRALALKIQTAHDARYVTRFTDKDGKLLAEVAGTAPAYEIKGNEGYVRATVTSSNGAMAWTQPVFLSSRRGQSQLGGQASQ